MNEEAAEPAVIDQPEEGRFVVELEGHTAELVYRAESGRLILVHTGVPSELEGRGIGSVLVRAAVARAAEQGLTVVPWCPFARQWLQAHPDVADSVTIDWRQPEPL